MTDMILGFTGRRTYTDEKDFEQRVEEVLAEYNLNVVKIVHGNQKKGLDGIAKRWAQKKGIPDIPHNPDYNKYPGWQAPLERNTLIVQDSDVIFAFWDGIEKGGTWDTIKKTREAEKDLIIFYI